MWDWLFAFIDPLERLSIPYALVGSVAVLGNQLDLPWLQDEVARLRLADEWRRAAGTGIS